ncbi:hypothetical protein ACSZMR_13460 [Aeromonas veronii]
MQVPESLDGPTSLAASERTRAAQHFQSNPGTPFTFKVYKRQDVVNALNTLFHGKCAYCESNIKSVQPTDIEHFRPKGRVADCPTHPGYWWLAAQWDNLLPSCIDCNRRRYQTLEQIASDPFDGVANGQVNLGKGDLFPILGANYAFRETDDHDAEDPALIDPTRRDPKAHLVWLQERELSLIAPREQNGVLDPYGRHTYRVFGLNRQGLVESRTARLREIKLQIVFIEQTLDMTFSMQEPFASDLRRITFEQLSSLYRYAELDQPFSAMVEDLLERESMRLMDKYQSLIAS